MSDQNSFDLFFPHQNTKSVLKFVFEESEIHELCNTLKYIFKGVTTSSPKCLYETRSLKFLLYTLFPVISNKPPHPRETRAPFCLSTGHLHSTQGTEEHRSKTRLQFNLERERKALLLLGSTKEGCVEVKEERVRLWHLRVDIKNYFLPIRSCSSVSYTYYKLLSISQEKKNDF